MLRGSNEKNRWMLVGLLLLTFVTGCVEAGEIPYVAAPTEIEILPDSDTLWVDHSGGATDGWKLRVPAGAVKEATYLRLSSLAATQTPLAAQGWELALPAVALTPIEVVFAKPAELIVPQKPPLKKMQILYAPDVTHIAAEVWEFTDVVTTPGEIRISLPLTNTFWPVVSLSVVAPSAATEPVVCVDPFLEKEMDQAMEVPEAEGECSGDSGCVVSGCQNEVCAPVTRATECLPPPRICAGGCACIAGVCRWLQ